MRAEMMRTNTSRHVSPCWDHSQAVPSSQPSSILMGLVRPAPFTPKRRSERREAVVENAPSRPLRSTFVASNFFFMVDDAADEP